MSLRSPRRQPCSVGSCMVWSPKTSRPAQAGAEMRAFHSELFRLGVARVGYQRRGAVVVGEGEPEALGAKASPPTAKGHVQHMLPRPGRPPRKPLLPADQATAPFRSHRRRDRSSGAWHRSRWFRSRHRIGSTRPCRRRAVMTRAPSDGRRQDRAAMDRSVRRSAPVLGDQQQRSSPSTNTAVAPRKCAATTAAPAAIGLYARRRMGCWSRVSVTARLPPADSRTVLLCREVPGNPSPRPWKCRSTGSVAAHDGTQNVNSIAQAGLQPDRGVTKLSRNQAIVHSNHASIGPANFGEATAHHDETSEARTHRSIRSMSESCRAAPRAPRPYEGKS